MGFTSSGTTVTQTGTDTVTTNTTIGGAARSLENNITVFDFAGKNLTISGTLNLPEGIAFHGIGQLHGTGVLNIGTEKLNKADYNYNNGVVNFWAHTLNANCDVTISIYGGSFINEASFNTNNPVTIRNSRWNIKGRFDPVGGGVMTDSILNMYNTTVYWFVRASFSEWNNNIVTAPSYFSLSTSTAAGDFTFKNITLRTGQDLIHYGSNSVNRILNIYNLNVGTNYLTNNITLAGTRNFTLKLYQEFIDNISDTSGVGIQGAKVYIKGNATSNQEGVSDNLGNTSIDFLYHKNIKTSGVEARTEYHNGSDELEKHIFSYNHFSPPPKIFTVKNASAYNEVTAILVDQNITETTKATVDAYTSIDNLDKLYDRAKSWKVDSANVEVPTVSDLLFVGNGKELVLHNNWSLVLDNTATDVIGVNSTTKVITIKASVLDEDAKFKTLEAQGTGTITAANSESINVGYIDANGNSFVDFISVLESVDTWKVFLTEGNRDANTSEDGTGNGTKNYRFNFTTATTLYLRIVRASTGAIIPINLQVTVSGSQAVSFDPSIIAAQTNALVAQINNTIKYLPSEVFVNVSLTDVGNGSHKEPFNTIADAVTFADDNNVDAIVLLSNITLNAALTNHDIRGSKAELDVNFGGQNVNGSRFYEIHLEGSVMGSFDSHDAHIHQVNGLQGKHYGAFISGTNIVRGEIHLIKGHAEAEHSVILDLTGQSNVLIEIHGLTGRITIANSTDSTNKVYIAAGEASVIFAASNTDGVFIIDMAASLEDNSTGATVTSNNVLDITDGKVTISDAQNQIIIDARDEATIAANNGQT